MTHQGSLSRCHHLDFSVASRLRGDAKVPTATPRPLERLCYHQVKARMLELCLLRPPLRQQWGLLQWEAAGGIVLLQGDTGRSWEAARIAERVRQQPWPDAAWR